MTGRYMKDNKDGAEGGMSADARDWVRTLAMYRDPKHSRSIFEIAVTAVPFLLLWTVAWWALSLSYLLAIGIALGNGAFLVRLFAIQHDCGHYAFFRNRTASDWVGRVLGVVTLTPYDVWKRTHAMHHSASGNLEKRGVGDVHTMTVEEYRAATRFQRVQYRLYRNPIILFGLGPSFIFLLTNRLPFGLMKSLKYWGSAMATNLASFLVLAGIVYFGGWMPLVLIFLPTSIAGATIGLWLFFVQHQFEETHWDNDGDWDLHDAALNGSSHYVMPKPLQWMTANIGIHHVHHLYNRIPFYRLTEVLRDHPVLANAQRLTIRESLSCWKLQLWDERGRQLLSFADMKTRYGPL